MRNTKRNTLNDIKIPFPRRRLPFVGERPVLTFRGSPELKAYKEAVCVDGISFSEFSRALWEYLMMKNARLELTADGYRIIECPDPWWKKEGEK